MPHSYTRIWIHAIFGTKFRRPLIKTDIEKDIFEHLREQLFEISCPARIINGMPDHVHILFLQNPKMPIDDIIKQVKGETSHWINGQDIMEEKFAWQTGYASYSVCDRHMENIFEYIKNQKTHHTKKSFLEEYEELVLENGLEWDPVQSD